ARLRAEGDSGCQLPQASVHGVCDDAIQADGAEREAEQAERGEHRREERTPLARTIVALEPTTNGEAQPRRHALELVPNRDAETGRACGPADAVASHDQLAVSIAVVPVDHIETRLRRKVAVRARLQLDRPYDTHHAQPRAFRRLRTKLDHSPDGRREAGPEA